MSLLLVSVAAGLAAGGVLKAAGMTKPATAVISALIGVGVLFTLTLC